MAHIFVLYRLKAGVSREDLSTFLKFQILLDFSMRTFGERFLSKTWKNLLVSLTSQNIYWPLQLRTTN